MQSRIHILLFVVLGAVWLNGQSIYYVLTNPRMQDTTHYLVDVTAYSNEPFRLGSGQLYFNYNTDAFGSFVNQEGSIEVILPEYSVLNAKKESFRIYGNTVTNDNTPSRVSYSWQQSVSSGCIEEDNINRYSEVLFTLKLKYLKGKHQEDPELCIEGGDVYTSQTFSACGPEDCMISNCVKYPGRHITTDYYSCDDCSIVYSIADSGKGSLRDAIGCVAAGDTIRFAGNLLTDTISLVSQYSISKDVSLVAKENLKLVVDGEGSDRVFDVLAGNQVLLEGIEIVAGSSTEGSAIRNAGRLTLKDFMIRYKTSAQDIISNTDSIKISNRVRIKKMNN